MSATFRSRVFRLLLLFAAVPSVILTVIGYYLAIDTGPGAEAVTTGVSEELQKYFFDRVYTDLERALTTNEPDSIVSRSSVDFILRLDSTESRITSSVGSLTPSVQEDIRLAVQRGTKRGLMASGSGFSQFAVQHTPSGEVLVGGVTYDSTFVRLVETTRASSATRSSERELHSRYVVFLGLLFLSVTLVAILAAYVFSARVSLHLAQPVTALSRAAEKIASGDFKQQVRVDAQDELGMLVANFNTMAAHLDETTARLAQTERVAAWRHVARRFAHELKNPLQPILVSLYRIEQQLSGSPQWDQVKEPLRAAGDEVKHLTALAERFSSLAKLPPPHLEEFDLSTLIASTAELYTEKLHPLRFGLNLPEKPVHVVSDAAYLREALHNLLQNALDACHDGDSLTVTLTIEPETLEITVADSGPGMDAATLASARLPYFTTKAKGNGLGLAIVERSMAELGGRLKVESRLNEGTRVTLILPGGERSCQPES
jgi:nitrogen fixation/metabolism regulation signal transduction histidine kinase